MKSLIALSTTEEEYISLSSSLREFIGVLNLMNELKERKFSFNRSIPKIKCRVFKDNMSCIDIAKIIVRDLTLNISRSIYITFDII